MGRAPARAWLGGCGPPCDAVTELGEGAVLAVRHAVHRHLALPPLLQLAGLLVRPACTRPRVLSDCHADHSAAWQQYDQKVR